ncbi:sugar phosphate isomerase/epimerase family protein [Falsiroseomonas oryzae]|uniref:sugar phosphate isomerase/epimerase family protein n=1 Tax=Falsiroseomonas oryzae TaxID=2766473 RepID=UPI0022EA5F06|nr:sugar phosphate isomerase/epimerase family protein [Roseomonas sp. MO-31]
MRYGMNLLLWTTEVTEGHWPVFERLKAIGYDLVEVPVFETADVDGYVRLGARLRNLGLTPHAVTAIGPEANIADADPGLRAAGEAQLRAMVDCAAALGAPTLSGPIHSAIGVFTGSGPTAEEIARSAEILARIADHARPHGVRLAIEPLNRFECYLLNDLASAAAFARRVAPDAGVLYDTFHAHIEEKDVAAAIAADADRIALVHVSENDRSTPGRGQVRWRDNFAALKAAGYQGPLIVEAFGLALPALSAATRIWRRMFDDEFTLAAEALAFMRREWEAA